MAKTHRKLGLKKETLRRLTIRTSRLAQVAGGTLRYTATLNPDTAYPNTDVPDDDTLGGVVTGSAWSICGCQSADGGCR